MEATGEAAGLLDQIVPPRLEDAGLEDCALPPESIKEAFLKAASAVRSHATAIFSDFDDGSDGDCVNDPWTGLGDSADKLVGITPEADPPGACAAKKGGGMPEVMGDDVVVPGVREAEEGADKVLEPEVPKGGEACIDGLEGLNIGEKPKLRDENDGKEEEEDEREGDKPILAEAYV